jgi:hypothetical protein
MSNETRNSGAAGSKELVKEIRFEVHTAMCLIMAVQDL